MYSWFPSWDVYRFKLSPTSFIMCCVIHRKDWVSAMADGLLPGCMSDIVFAASTWANAPFLCHPAQSNLNWRIRPDLYAGSLHTHDCTDTSVHDLQLRKTARVEKGHFVIKSRDWKASGLLYCFHCHSTSMQLGSSLAPLYVLI